MPTSQGHREECSYRSDTQLRTYDRKDSLKGGKGLRCKTFLLPQLCPYSTTSGGSALEAKSHQIQVRQPLGTMVPPQ